MAEKKVDLLKKELIKEFGELVDFSFFCFDYFFQIEKGKFKGKKVLIKRVKDANTITKKSYNYLVTFSALTDSIPIIIADNYNVKNKIKDDVLYEYKKVPMMNEDTFMSLLEEGKIYFMHRYSIKPVIKENEVGEKVIDENTLKTIKEEFEKIKKEIKKDLVLINKLVDYYFNPKDLFIKNTKKFEFKKEQKIIKFAEKTEKNMVFISEKHRNPLINENFIVIPKDFLNKKELTESIIEIWERFFEM